MAAHAQIVVLLKLHSSVIRVAVTSNFKLRWQPLFSVSEVLANFYNYLKSRVIVPEEVAALSRAITSEPIASSSSSASIDRLSALLRRTKNSSKVNVDK